MSSQFGNYSVIEKIDHGAMGDIFLVEDNEKKRFALKTLRSCIDSSSDSEFKARFIREISLSEKINHPNIVRNYFHDLDGDQAYMVMEYLSGGSLETQIKMNRQLDPEVVLKVAIDICKALDECHKNDIIHRDVKPANILIAEDGANKLADLGLARLSGISASGNENLTMSQTALGTPYYISPEQAIDAKNVDIRSDIYSLGATLYYALTGKRVHEGSSSVHVIMKHVNNEITHPDKIRPGLPKKLTDVIMKMLEKKPEHRYQTPEEMLHDLQTVDILEVNSENEPATKIELNKSGASNKTGMVMFSVLAGIIFVACAAIFRVSCLPPSSADTFYLKARSELKMNEETLSNASIPERIKKIEIFLDDYPNARDSEQIQTALKVAKLLTEKKDFHVTLKKVGNLKEARSFAFRLFIDDKKFEFKTDERKKVLYPEARMKISWNLNSSVKMEFEEFEWLDDLIYTEEISGYNSLRSLSGSKIYKVKPAFSDYFGNGEFHVQYEMDEIKETEWLEFEKYFFPGKSW